MRHLYHYWFCPNSRKVRISLLEKSMDCELILELPEIPMLVINALKQIEKGSLKQENSKKQTEAILSQLRENSLKERATIIAISLLALTGFLVTQSIWTYAAVSAFSSLIFWFKSR